MAADRLLACWRRTEDLHTLPLPASADEIAAAEAELNLALPDLLRQIYLFSKGPWLFGGCLNLDVLRNPEGLGLTTSSRLLREWEWPIPEEILVFGGDGSEEVYGLWLGARDQARFPDPVLAFVEGAGPYLCRDRPARIPHGRNGDPPGARRAGTGGGRLPRRAPSPGGSQRT
jgi:hypothetical protein